MNAAGRFGFARAACAAAVAVGCAIAALSIAARPLTVHAQSPQLRLVSTAWPPFTNPAGQPRFALDLVEAALGRFGLRADTAIVDAAQFTQSILNFPYDGSAAAWKDPERERVLLFSRPYLENRLILVGRRGADVSATKLADLKGRKIAIVGGYAYGDDVDAAGPSLVRSKSEEDSLRLLLDSSVDYTIMDELVVQYILDHHAEEARTRLQLGTTPLVVRPLYLAVRRSRTDAQSIVDRFNAQLRGMIADHTYHRLLHVAWINADVDGDGVTEYVAASDKSGSSEPQHAYTLVTGDAKASDTGKKRYYVGGNLYEQWASVPERYKTDEPQPSRSTASIFTFRW